MIVERVHELQELANHAKLAQLGSGEAAMLGNHLGRLKRGVERVDAATAALSALPGATVTLAHAADAHAIENVLASLDGTSAIEVATSTAGEAAVATIERAADHFGHEAEARWRQLCDGCAGVLSREFVSSMARIATYRSVATEALALQDSLQGLIGVRALPDPGRVRRVVALRHELEALVGSLQNSVPADVRPLLQRSMSPSGLPLSEVTDGFLSWARDHRLEDTFCLRLC